MNKPQRHSVTDSLYNLLTGLGLSNRDKSVATYYAFNPLNIEQLESAYRGDWVARKAVDIPAFDMTREWREWQAEKDQIEKIEEEEKRLGLQRKLKRALICARLYGGGALFMGINDDDPATPLDPETVEEGGLRYVHCASANELSAHEVETDPNNEYFGTPRAYVLSSKTGMRTEIHPSRVVRLVGAELPDSQRTVATMSGWGDSILQAIDSEIKNVGMTTQGIASMIQECKLDVIKVPNLSASLSTQDGKDILVERFQMSALMKSLHNVTLLDIEEEWNRINITWSGIPDVLKLYLLIASGACDIPATRFLGQEPAGMNSTGESDIRNYYDRLRANQTTEMQPAMRLLDECLIRSALGSRPDEVWFQWSPLWQMDEKTKAEVAKSKADAFAIDVNAGLINPEALREGRENQLIEDGVYPGFDQILEETAELPLDEMAPQVQAAFSARTAPPPDPNAEPDEDDDEDIPEDEADDAIPPSLRRARRRARKRYRDMVKKTARRSKDSGPFDGGRFIKNPETGRFEGSEPGGGRQSPAGGTKRPEGQEEEKSKSPTAEKLSEKYGADDTTAELVAEQLDVVGADPDEIADKLGGPLKAQEDFEVVSEKFRLVSDGAIEYTLRYRGGDEKIHELRRSINFSDESVHHDYFTMPEDWQGTGIGKEILRSQVELYDRFGINRVETLANIDVGSYAWAKYGFVPSVKDWNDVRLTAIGQISRLGGDEFPYDQRDKVMGILKDPNVYAMWDLVDSKAQVTYRAGETTTVGKFLLTDRYGNEAPSWQAELDLNDRDARARFNAYVGK